MSKISIIGAGNVGATAAQFIAMSEVVDDVILIDVKENYAEGKAVDISQSLILLGSRTKVSGYTGNYEPTKDSDVIVITSGVPRKPGMTREELVGTNANVVKSVLSKTHKYSPKAIYVIVSNPVDTMTYLGVKYLKKLGKEDSETTVLGMGGLLDTARFHYYQDIAGLPYADGEVVGGHGDTTMIPLFDESQRKDVSDSLAEAIVEKTKIGGATLTGMLGTSAWMAPAAAIKEVVSDIINNFTFGEFPHSVYRPEYDACIGTPVCIGKHGVLSISREDYEDSDKFQNSLKAVKEVNKALGEI